MDLLALSLLVTAALADPALAVSLYLTLAQAAAPNDLMGWLTGSAVTVLALVVVGFLKRWIVTGAELTGALQRAEKAEAKVDALQEYIRDRTLPALIRVNDVLARGVEVTAAEFTRSRREEP